MMCFLGFVEIYKEYMALHRYVVGRRRNILIAFSNNFQYSSLIFHQNSVDSSLLKIGCNVESVILKSIGLSYTLNGYFTHVWFLVTLYIDNLENIGSLVQILQMLTYVKLINKKYHIC